ncbi:MAG: DNA (cytosine-5-)-methyltransferase [Prevotella sp.]|nr:DNA (cytosine-5-)-methyltransferase [Prevotella sp.]
MNKNIQETPLDVEGLNWSLRQFSSPDKTIRLATTFSGIGAIEYAFKRLNLKHEIVFAGDINDNCRASYFANYKLLQESWHSDIHMLDAKPYRNKVDLLVGGAPCQAFSIVGNRKGFDDTRGTLFREFARIIKECSPKVFLFENVQGLYNHDNGQTWEVITNTFRDYCGYHIYFRRLNSKNYGIPQHRERLYCVGFRKQTDFLFPAPIDCPYIMYDFMEDYRGGNYYVKEYDCKVLTPHIERKKELAKGTIKPLYNEFVFKCSDVEDKHYLSQSVYDYVLAGGSKSFKTSTKTDLEIARPLLQSMHKMHRAGVDNYVSYNKNKGINGLRRLTPRECLRLMGFTDDFNEVVSNTSLYMQAGNSIVVDVLIAMLKQIDITKYGVDE